MPAWVTEFSSRFDLALAGLALALLILRLRQASRLARTRKLADPAAAALEARKEHYQFLFLANIAAMGFGAVTRAGVGFECPMFSLSLYMYLLSRNPDILSPKKIDSPRAVDSSKKQPREPLGIPIIGLGARDDDPKE